MIALSLAVALGLFTGIAGMTTNASAFVCAWYNSNCDPTPGQGSQNIQCLPAARDLGKC
jgi:hypothetical protein